MAPKDSDYSNVTPLSDIIDAFTSLTVPKDKPVIILNKLVHQEIRKVKIDKVNS